MPLTLPDSLRDKAPRWHQLWFAGDIFPILVTSPNREGLRAALAAWDKWQQGQNRYGVAKLPDWSYQRDVARSLLYLAEHAAAKGETLPDTVPDFVQHWRAKVGPACLADALALLRQSPRRALPNTRQSGFVLIAEDNGQWGRLVKLEVELVADGTGQLYPDPASNTALRYAADFLATARQAWAQLCQPAQNAGLRQLDARFRLIAAGPRQGREVKDFLWGVGGSSATAAFYLCLDQAIRAYLETPDTFTLNNEPFAITAAMPDLAQGGLSLGKVGEMFAKVRAAAWADLSLVIVTQSNHAEARQHLDALAPSRRGNLQLRAHNDIHEVLATLRTRAQEKEAVRRHEQKLCAKLKWLNRAVDTAAHYQSLPLLQTVSHDDLLHAPDAKEDAGRPAWRELDVRQWEERQNNRFVALTVSHTAPEVFTDFSRVLAAALPHLRRPPAETAPRFFLLGSPGAGKSALCQYLAWACGQQRETALTDERGHNWRLLAGNGVALIPARVQLPEWEKWAAGRNEYHLPEFLANHSRGLSPAPTAVHWQTWLEHGEVLLLLDSLDETGHSDTFHQHLQQTLTLYAVCPTVITCRTVSFETHQNLAPDWPLFSLRGLTPAQQERFIAAYAQHARNCDAARLAEHLRQTPQLRALAANPLLLAVFCFAGSAEEMPETRSALYARAAGKLLDPATQRVAAGWTEDPEERHIVLERAALALWLADEERAIAFSQNEFVNHLAAALKAVGYDHDCRPLAQQFCRELKRSGLLRGKSGQAHFFLHLTLQEYFVASALARHINEGGWEAGIAVGKSWRSVRALLNAKAWSPHWNEVFSLLAGQLNEPEPLLQLLADAGQDDHFRHRLALAVSCIGGLNEAQTKDNPLISKIIREAFAFWWEHCQQGTRRCVAAHTLAWQTLWASPAGHLLARECEILLQQSQDVAIRQRATHCFGLLGEKIARPELLALFGVLLEDDRQDVLYTALSVLAKLAWTDYEALLQLLLPLLTNTRQGVRETAAIVFSQWAAEATETEVAEALKQLAQQPGKAARQSAARFIGELGVPSSLADTLAWLRRDPEASVRRAALAATAQLGAERATPELLRELAGLLSDNDKGVCWQTAEALAALGRNNTELRASMEELSRNAKPPAQQLAGYILEKLTAPPVVAPAPARPGPPLTPAPQQVNSPAVIAALLADLDSGAVKKMIAAAEKFAVLGESLVTRELLHKLFALQKHEKRPVRQSAARTWSKLAGHLRLLVDDTGERRFDPWHDLAK